MHDRKMRLRVSVALLGGEPIPPGRLSIILGATLTVGIHEPEMELRDSVALLCVHPKRRTR